MSDYLKLFRLVEEAFTIRMYGERAPGGSENWADWERKAEETLRSLGALRGQPGNGCQDTGSVHPHWCRACGARTFFSRDMCYSLRIVPPCMHCEANEGWRSDVDG